MLFWLGSQAGALVEQNFAEFSSMMESGLAEVIIYAACTFGHPDPSVQALLKSAVASKRFRMMRKGSRLPRLANVFLYRRIDNITKASPHHRLTLAEPLP